MSPRIWSFSTLPKYLEQLGIRSVFLVADEGAYAHSGAERMLKQAFGTRHVVRFSDFTANPKAEEIDRALRVFRADRFDLIVAVGGGSAIDVAKLTRACDRPDLTATAVIQGRAAVAQARPPLLAIPTTAGTGAEATHFSAVYVEGRKHSLAHRSMRPEHVILDERLLESSPRGITLQTGLDATCQAIESMWSTRSTAVSMRWADRALRLAWEALPACMNAPTPRARRKMLLAAHLAGRAIDISQTTACHALSYTLTSHYGIPHGRAVALMLGPVWSFNAAVDEGTVADPRGVAHVQRVMERLAAIVGTDSAATAASIIKAHLTALGAAVNFRDCGVPAEEAIELISREVDPLRAGNNPRRIGPDQAHTLLLPLMGVA